MIEITDVRIRKVNGNGKLKGYVSITIDDVFVVHDLKIIEGKKGYFVAMPSKKLLNGEFKDTAHPIATEARNLIQKTVLEKYKEEVGEEISISEVGKGDEEEFHNIEGEELSSNE